jgi:beta-lactam-binding protein with PASTA domain
MCNVPALKGLKLAAAKGALASANCRVGKVTYVYSKIARGLVSSQKPGAGSVRPAGTRVSLVVSLGRKR